MIKIWYLECVPLVDCFAVKRMRALDEGEEWMRRSNEKQCC